MDKQKRGLRIWIFVISLVVIATVIFCLFRTNAKIVATLSNADKVTLRCVTMLPQDFADIELNEEQKIELENIIRAEMFLPTPHLVANTGKPTCGAFYTISIYQGTEKHIINYDSNGYITADWLNRGKPLKVVSNRWSSFANQFIFEKQ